MKHFEKIIGYKSVKEELEQISDVLRESEKYKKFGVSAPKGLLLFGEPGLGKTLMAKSLIEASERKYYICRKDKPNGEFVNAIKETFDKAVQNAPSIVFLDDMDKFANGDMRHPDAEEYVTVQSCIDEVKGKEVFVLATANNIDNLPRSLKRVGRFDRVIEIENPKGEDALLITKHYLKKTRFEMDVDIDTIAKIMYGSTCAELETIINEAGLYARYENSPKITMQHFMRAYIKIATDIDPNGFDSLSKYKAIDLKNARNRKTQAIYHEAGHTAVSEILDSGSVAFVCVFETENGANGLTRSYLCMDRKLDRNATEVIVSLAGRAVTELKFGVIDYGCYKDLQRATGIIQMMVKNLAMCGFAFGTTADYRTDTWASKQEMIVAAELEKIYLKVKQIIASNWEYIDKLAEALADKGMLLASEIQELKSQCDITLIDYDF